MKTIVFIPVFLFSTTVFSQNTEFTPFSNGLIYSDTTIQQLHQIIDSLNLKFKICELNKTNLSKLQACAYYISLDTGNIKNAEKDILQNISFDDFIKKYTYAKIQKDLLVVRFAYKDYSDEDVVEYSGINLTDAYPPSIRLTKDMVSFRLPLKGRWVFKYFKNTSYSNESLEAFYLTELLESAPLQTSYARMVQYADCMIDTNTQIFYEQDQDRTRSSEAKSGDHIEAFMKYLQQFNKQPSYDGEDWEKYALQYQIWDSLRIVKADSLKRTDKKFDLLFQAALKEALAGAGTDNEFEEYVGRYYAKQKELELKRHRIVVGGCSQDQAPRRHALRIAELAAETIQWDIFLRAHLDIMNDNFKRMTDGNYAWARRKTYLRELEVLEINVPDLLIGISLRIENPSTNHYYGNIGRIGRALAESEHPDEIESRLVSMIGDNHLDDYNRVLLYFLFRHYNKNIADEDRKKKNEIKLVMAEKSLPDYLQR